MLREQVLWLRSSGLAIVLLIIGAVLFSRLVHFSAQVSTQILARREAERADAGLLPSEQAKYFHAVVQVTEWAAISLGYFVTFILVLMHFGLPLTTLVAPATLIGAALGFGAQRIVQDLLSGFFLFAERQFGVGDLVQISQPGATTGTRGTVERLTLRVTELRAAGGELVIIPNGELRQVTNLSRGWSQVLVDIPISGSEDVQRAISVLGGVVSGIAEDEAWKTILLDTPTVTGVESIQVGYFVIRLTARTHPGKQWDLARELRQRSALALRKEGVAPATISTNVTPSPGGPPGHG